MSVHGGVEGLIENLLAMGLKTRVSLVEFAYEPASPHVAAALRIKPGEEITYNYGKNYFETFIKPAGCRCRSCERKRAKQAGA